MAKATVSRRDSMAKLLSAASLAAVSLPGAARAADGVGDVFIGRYSDPNHPGGFREVFLLSRSLYLPCL
jgi:hypothetical protein